VQKSCEKIVTVSLAVFFFPASRGGLCVPESKDPLPGVSGFYILGEGKPLFYRKKVGDRSQKTQK